jgi:release factor glutamine methyltransferase
MTARQALREAERRLAAAGVPTPRVDAELLLAHVLGTTRSGVRARLDEPVDGSFEVLLARRELREPLAYVLGEWGFRRLTLHVDRRVLVPRPETEVLVERCLELIRPLERPQVLDVGTGSGAIALALADEHPGAQAVAIDSSPDALALACANARDLGMEARITFREHDLVNGLDLGRRFDLVVSNPPYVLRDEIDELEPEVREWEPRAALVGDVVDGHVAEAARAVLEPGGWVALETAAGRAATLVQELQRLGYADIRSTPDLAGIDRVVEARWPPTP